MKDIYRSTMEQTGEISFIPNEDVRPLQPKDIHLQPTPTYIPIPIIIDGEIQTSNLSYLVKDHDWLITQLTSYNLDIKELDKVVLAT
ncbi:YetF domain-containing protein [Bacillus sp. ISL-34]|uniref:YetF domain-containing protein n=1 Tax=Bacillus sp. ISL-34 TaxID=2819121 RepID=UPI002852F0D3|nr:YetF domain-containing protein [Bacillus sp. ISL-34]